MKNPYLAMIFSVLVPGLGQLYLGERAKGWTLVCMSAGIVVSLFISHTPIVWVLMGGIYLAVMIPAASDAFRTASGRPRTFMADTVPYVIMMLLLVGPFAVPLLWQSRKFSRLAKFLWTAGVILVALVAIVVTTLLASSMEGLMRQGTSA
jgi:hypothetical protein